VIVPGNSQANSQPPKPDKNHAHYLISDGLPGINSYQHEMNSNPVPQSNGPILQQPGANQPQSSPVQELFKDGRSKPKSNPVQTASSQPQQESDATASQAQFVLRTSVIGPEALLKDQSDDYEPTSSFK